MEFKRQAVKLSQLDSVEVQAVADALDIHPFMLSRWRKEAPEGLFVVSSGKPGLDARQAAELASRGVTFCPLKDAHDGLRGFELRDTDGWVLSLGRPRT